MTRLLASVRTAEEARLALEGGADIIDAKEPGVGALGRLSDSIVRSIVAEVGGRAPVSATIGDLPLEPDRTLDEVRRMAFNGVDIVKIGVFSGDAAVTIDYLRDTAHDGVRIVAVFLADLQPDLDLIVHCRASGFYGVMLDTADKRSGPLTRHIDRQGLQTFVTKAHEHGLAAGLAGSLRAEDVTNLIGLAPDYLGFRSALTRGGRETMLDPASLAAVRGEIEAARRAMNAA